MMAHKMHTSIFKIEATLLNYVMDTRFELQYKAVAELCSHNQ